MMKRFLSLAVVAVALFVWAPVQASSEQVTNFNSQATLSKTGTLDVTETITYDFGSASHHGIFRKIATDYPAPNGKHYYLKLDYMGAVLISGTGVLQSAAVSGSYTGITGVGALTAGSIGSGFTTISTSSTITGTTINGTTGINTGASAGTQRIDSSGNLVNIGNITSTGTTSHTGNTTVNTGTSNSLAITSGTSVPTTDQLTINNTGSTGVITAGVNGFSINYKGGAAVVESAAQRIDIQPGTSSGGKCGSQQPCLF